MSRASEPVGHHHAYILIMGIPEGEEIEKMTERILDEISENSLNLMKSL